MNDEPTTSAAADAPGSARPPWVLLAVLALGTALGAWWVLGQLAQGWVDEAIRKGAPRYQERADLMLAVRPRLVLVFVPLVTLALGAFHPRLLGALRSWRPGAVAALAAGLAAWTLVLPAYGFFSSKVFDAYLPVVLAALGGAAALAGRRLERPEAGLCGVALLIWLALWMPFDLRLYGEVWLGPPKLDVEYALFALLVTDLAVLAYAVNGKDDLLLRLPRLGDLGHGAGWLVAFGAIAIPLGIAVKFLDPHVADTAPVAAVVLWLAIAVTIALPEELFFRGVLDRRLQGTFARPWVSLLISSFAFGLMHWNNRDDLVAKAAYVGFATLAGVFYGLAARKSRGLVAPVAAHASVDLVWQVWLR